LSQIYKTMWKQGMTRSPPNFMPKSHVGEWYVWISHVHYPLTQSCDHDGCLKSHCMGFHKIKLIKSLFVTINIVLFLKQLKGHIDIGQVATCTIGANNPLIKLVHRTIICVVQLYTPPISHQLFTTKVVCLGNKKATFCWILSNVLVQL